MKTRYYFLFISYLLFSQLLIAQDGHYWTQQYGTRSMLLSGSVIGGVEDLGAVYYNPARLSQVENPAFLISADVYELNRIQINNAFGDNIGSTQQDVTGVPSLAAGTFKVKFLENHSFAWAILIRSNLDLSFSYSNEVYGNVIENFPGEEYFNGKVSISQNTREQWTGFSWSYPLTEKLSLGASGYLSLYNQKKGSSIYLRAYSASNNTASYDYDKNFKIEQYSLLGKFGFSYKTKKVVAGITFLSPRLYLKGSSNYGFQEYFSGIEGESVGDDVFTSNSQSNITTKYKSAYGIGGGITFLVKRSKIHLSSEWFSALPKYTIMEINDHYSQSHGDTLSFKLVDQLSSVTNVGLGIELYLNEKVSAYLSACTDHSAVNSDINRFTQNLSETNNSILRANFYHFGGGVVLHLKGADITLGGTYTGASQQFDRPINFPDDAGDQIFDDNDKAEMEWDRVRFVFSFSLPFLKDVQQKVEDKIGL